MNNDVEHFRSTIVEHSPIDPHDHRLLIEQHDRLACCYAPFEHVNPNAKIVLLGITPGAQQAGNAINALRSAMRAGISTDQALEQAKQSASFSGPMRNNLVAMLDRIGMQRALGIETCARLFDNRTDLVHFTSALRYPVFVDGKDYSGSPSILSTLALRSMTQRWLGTEIAQLHDAFWIPLGKEPAAVLADFVSRGELMGDRVLAGMPHPSGANAERIAYFLGNKNRENLSTKTNAAQFDAARCRLTQLVTQTSQHARPKYSASQEVLAQSKCASADQPVSNRPTEDDDGAGTRRVLGQSRELADPTSRFATTFRLVGHLGESIHPVRIKNRNTGNIAFVLAPRGSGTHKREHAIEVSDEAKAYEMVRSGTFKIRATRHAKEPASLLGLGDRVVKGIVRI